MGRSPEGWEGLDEGTGQKLCRAGLEQLGRVGLEQLGRAGLKQLGRVGLGKLGRAGLELGSTDSHRNSGTGPEEVELE